MSQLTDVQQRLLALAVRWKPVGSQVTCNPAPVGSDFDYLVQIRPEEAESFCAGMAVSGFEIELGAGYAASVLANSFDADVFNSYRAGDVNFIVTSSPTFFNKFMAATSLAKRFNLLNKQDRVDLFQAVLYGVAPFDLPPLPKLDVNYPFG